MAIYLTFSQLI